MARSRWQAGIYSLNNIDTGVAIECTVDNKKVFVPPNSSLTVVARNYISRDDTLVKLEISYVGQIENDKLGISGNITAGT